MFFKLGSTKTKRGFTMVELLAVISILAIIMILLVPAIMNVRRETGKSITESKIDAVRKAAENYGEDNINTVQKYCSTTSKNTNCCIKIKDLINGGYIDADEVESTAEDDLSKGAVYLSYDKTKIKVIGSVYEDDVCTKPFEDEESRKPINDNTNSSTPSNRNTCTNTTINDGTSDNNTRYVGKNPCNYVRFNNELWRIIGTFNNIKSSDGDTGAKLKIVRMSSVGNRAYDNDNNSSWSNSSLKSYLNDVYYNGLKDNYKSMVSDAIWNTGATTLTNSAASLYNNERNGSIPLTAHIGLIYPSDYLFAFSNNENYLYDKNYNQWTMTESSDNKAYYISRKSNESIKSGDVTNKSKVSPALYLKSTVIKMSGSGSIRDPYILEDAGNNPYTIVYNCNGGSNPPKNQDIRFNEGYTVSPNTCVRNGYTFKGWYSDTGENWTGQTGKWNFANGQKGIRNNILNLKAEWTDDNACDGSIVQDGTSDNNSRYIGKNPCNYVNFNGETWRIIGTFNNIQKDPNSKGETRMKIMKDTPIDKQQYSSTSSSDYSKSSLRTYLNGGYLNGLSEEAKSMIDTSVWHIGQLDDKPNAATVYKNERGNKVSKGVPNTVTDTIGLIYPSDYLYATGGGTDINRNKCLSDNVISWSNHSECADNDWVLIGNQNTWTITPGGDIEDELGAEISYIAYAKTGLSVDFVYFMNEVKPALYLKSAIEIKGGKGTKNDPLIIGDKNYNITYDLDGGTVANNPSTYTSEDTFTLKNPTKQGYTFQGWTGSNGNTPNTKVTISKGTRGDKNYKANWTSSVYKISLDNKDATTKGTDAIYEKYNDGVYADSDLTKKMATNANQINIPKKQYKITYNMNLNTEKPQNITDKIKDQAKSNSNLVYDETNDNNLRYKGLNPNNYVKFNNETWRIIGVFNNIQKTNGGTGETRVKIMKDTSIDKQQYSSTSSSNYSKSSLRSYLNGEYFNKLSNDAKNMIDTSVWHISQLDDEASPATVYKNERGNKVDSGVPNSVTDKVGLIYPSDYLYATNGGNTTSRNKCLSINYVNWSDNNDCINNDWVLTQNENTWTITPGGGIGDELGAEISYIAYAKTGLSVNFVYFENGVKPSVYLKSDVKISGGSGTSSDPYTLTTSNNSGETTPSNTSITVDSTFSGYYDGNIQMIDQNGYITQNLPSNKYTNVKTLTTKWVDNSAILPTPVRNGYIFTGWYTTATGGTKVGDGGDTYKPEFSTALYARWKKEDAAYNISLDNKDATTRGTGNIYEKYGKGIYKDSDLTSQMTTGTNPISIPKKEYRITYNMNADDDSSGTLTDKIRSKAKENNSNLVYDGTDENNLRYIGANPNNYIKFNNETWRIIGVFNNIKKDTNGKNETRIKIMRDTSIGDQKWSSGSSNWSTSSLRSYLNNDYLNSLSDQAKSMIDTSIWNLGQIENEGTKYIYDDERNGKVDDGVPSTVTDKIGLIYPSDYLFATDGGKNTSRDTCLNGSAMNWNDVNDCTVKDWVAHENENFWTITPGGSVEDNLGAETSYIIYAKNGLMGNFAYYEYGVKPTVYLKSNIKLSGGDGSKDNPYTITTSNGSDSSSLSNTSTTVSSAFNGYYDGSTQMINQNGYITDNFTNTKYTGAKTLNASWTDSSTTLPTPSRKKYAFVGWYTAASGGTKVGNGGDAYKPTINITLYARWTRVQEKYNIDLDNKDATTNGTGTIYEKYDDGIYTDLNYTNKMTNDSNPITRPKKEYTLTYSLDGGTIDKFSNLATQKIQNLAKTNKKELVADDGTADHNTRYIGNNPDNHVKFNDELWYIVGAFNNIDDGTGKKETRLKLVSYNLLGNYAWDSSYNSVNLGNGVNEWSQSVLAQELNTDYLGNITVGTDGHWYNGGSRNKTIAMPTRLLNKEAQSLIDNAVWNLGTDPGNGLYKTEGTAAKFYTYERSNNTGKTCNSSDESCNDNVTRTTKWTGKVALVYPSDYGFATAGGSTTDRNTCLSQPLYNWKNLSDCFNENYLAITAGGHEQWTITASNTLNQPYDAFYICSSGEVESGLNISSTLDVRPAVYLNSSVRITGGEGTLSDPYTLSSNPSESIISRFDGYYDGDTQMINQNGYITDNFTNTKYSTNHTLTAKWTDKEVTLPTPTKEGYTFAGWYTTPTGGSKIGNGGDTYKPSFSTTLYARWNKNPSTYNINLNANGATTPGTSTVYEKYGTGIYKDSSLTSQMTTGSNPATVPKKEITVTYSLDGSGGTNGVNKIQSLANTDTTNLLKDDGTADHNTRFIGKNPNNYIKFNNELWRIIGSFNNIDDGAGKKETRLKIVKAEKYDANAWNGDKDSGTNVYPNDWTKSSLKTDLNGYDGIASSYGYYNSLSVDAKNMVEDTVWHLGGIPTREASSLTSIQATAKDAYTKERGTSVSPSRPTTWTGKIALIYPSDYGYATSGNGSVSRTECYNILPNIVNSDSKETSCIENDWLKFNNPAWLLTPVSNLNNNAYYLESGQVISDNQSAGALYTSFDIYPTLYLKSGVNITGGSGTSSDPYTLTNSQKDSLTSTFNGYYDGSTQMINQNGYITSNFTSTKYTSSKTLNASWTDNTITLPTPKKEAYDFDGWYTSESGGTKVGNGGDSYSPKSSVTLYAHWSAKTIPVPNLSASDGIPSNGKHYGTGSLQITASTSTPYVNKIILDGKSFDGMTATTGYYSRSKIIKAKACYNDEVCSKEAEYVLNYYTTDKVTVSASNQADSNISSSTTVNHPVDSIKNNRSIVGTIYNSASNGQRISFNGVGTGSEKVSGTAIKKDRDSTCTNYSYSCPRGGDLAGMNCYYMGTCSAPVSYTCNSSTHELRGSTCYIKCDTFCSSSRNTKTGEISSNPNLGDPWVCVSYTCGGKPTNQTTQFCDCGSYAANKVGGSEPCVKSYSAYSTCSSYSYQCSSGYKEINDSCYRCDSGNPKADGKCYVGNYSYRYEIEYWYKV